LRLLLATHSLDHVGGSETYLLTAAEQLQRLGHEVTVHAAERGACAELARSRGIAADGEIPEACDAAIVQDAGMAHALAERLPDGAGECEERALAAESAADEAGQRARAAEAAASAAAERVEAVLSQRRVRAGVAAGRLADRVRGLVRR